MARLVTKFKYLKPDARKNIGGYAKYIATREGVEKIDDSQKYAPATVRQKRLIEKILSDFPDTKEMLEYEDYLKGQTIGSASEFISRAVEDCADEMMSSKTYADYIATRPRAQRFGSHGLFTDDGIQVQLSKVSEELNLHSGNVWTTIVSLRREDAERLGFDSGERWRDMLRTQTQALSENLKIPMENLKWFAAYHNESHHPHVHLMVYSTVENEGFLTKQGVTNLRSAFAKDIFAQDLHTVYETQTEHRNALRQQSKKMMEDIVSDINSGGCENPEIEKLLLRLSDKLKKTDGRKVYRYLNKSTKAVVDSIVAELSKDSRISALYDMWYGEKEKILQIYSEKPPDRIPLEQNEEFKVIRNAVIKEAQNIAENRFQSEDLSEPEQEITQPEPIEPFADDIIETPSDVYHSSGRKKKKTWWTDEYKQARTYLYGTLEIPPDLPNAFLAMTAEAKKGNALAMHDLGKMLLDGLGCDKNEDTAQEWFAKALSGFLAAEAKEEKNDYLQYRIGKMHSFGYGTEQSYEQAALWYQKAVNQGNGFAAYSLAGLYRRAQGVEQDDVQAFKLYTMAANNDEHPNAYAMWELGGMCKNGTGTAVNKTASDKWYKGAYRGFLAMEKTMADDKLWYRIGRMNLSGIGTEINYKNAERYFLKAKALDNDDSYYGLGQLYSTKAFAGYDIKKAIENYVKAADRGISFANYKLGKLYLDGKEIPKNTEYAIRYLEMAVEKENGQAEYLLGKTLLLGKDCPPDPARAEVLLKAAVKQENIFAAYTLGKAYLDGEVLQQNVPEAIGLLTFAAEKEFDAAQYKLGKLYLDGELVMQDITKAIAFLTQAAQQNNQYAQYKLGKLYLDGEKTAKDIGKAILWLTKAAEAENQYAEYVLGKLYLFGGDVEKDTKKAIRLLTSSAEHGNQFAAVLLKIYRSNKNYAAAMGAFRLLGQTAQIFQNKLQELQRNSIGRTDRKLRSKIEEKKAAHGIRIE